ncbi:hypothetical protein SB521682_4985 [Shigella boydii 5216-82]|nr:hypothetical protein SB521682_4985 [Shigella boydii 5216-82]
MNISKTGNYTILITVSHHVVLFYQIHQNKNNGELIEM